MIFLYRNMEIKLINEINLSPADQHQVAVFAKMNCLGSADFRDQNGSRMLKGSHWSHHRCKNGNLSVPSLQNRALHLPSAMERSAPRRPLGWQAAAFARPAAFAPNLSRTNSPRSHRSCPHSARTLRASGAQAVQAFAAV